MGLPSEFTALLSRPLPVALDELVPYTAVKVPKLGKKQEEAKPLGAFLSALNSIPTARTWNNALAHESTNDALLDLFNDLAPGVTAQNLFKRLDAAWAVDPEL